MILAKVMPSKGLHDYAAGVMNEMVEQLGCKNLV